MKEYLICMFILMITDIVFGAILEKYYLAKKCEYDCYKCKNWKCYKHYCDKKREELIKKDK